MNDIELLKSLPQEHWTLESGKWLKVADVLKALQATQRKKEKQLTAKKKRSK